MKKTTFLFLLISVLSHSQKFTIDTLLTDNISIRAIQLWDGKVWYAGTDSKFGYVNMKDKSDKNQIVLSDEKLEFRTLSQDKKYFYSINIESPAYFFQINKQNLNFKIVNGDDDPNAFYDALYFHKNRFYTFSDPNKDLDLNFSEFIVDKDIFYLKGFSGVKLNEGEAAFAASNTNIAASDNFVWIATGGKSSRIFRLDLHTQKFEIFETPFIQGTSSQGIFSIDFFDKNFGIAVGGDFAKQSDNVNNIATTNDGGESWQIQTSGQNPGYMTCVKFRPKSKGREIVAIGDQHISLSFDYGKTWTKISDEKNLYACEWLDKNTLILAGKNRILKLTFE